MRDFYLAKRTLFPNEFQNVFLFTGTASLLELKSLNKPQTILNRVRNLDEAAILKNSRQNGQQVLLIKLKQKDKLNLKWMLRSSVSPAHRAV